MRLLLLQPPVEDFYDTDVRLQPIGLCYLKAAVKHYLPEIEVVVRDYHAGYGRRTVALPAELTYLREYYPVADRSPFSTFHNYFRFGASGEQIVNDLQSLQPEVVGISSLFTPYYRQALRVAALVKQWRDVPVILGGSHVSAVPEFTLDHKHVDYVIRGEGERPLVELMEHFLGKREIKAVANVGYKINGIARFNPTQENFPIESLPWPDLSDLRQSEYRFEGRPMTFMITSRSCPHKCSFCSVHTTFGKRYRRRPVADVLAEIKLRHEQGYRVIDFEDDNLTYYKEEFKTLCRELIAMFPARDIRFVAMNGISYLSLDDEMLKLMKAAGFSQLNLALVSSDTTVRESTKRPHTLRKYQDVVYTAHALGLRMVSYQILGLPMESLDSMIQTLCFNAGLPVLLGASPYYQTPNAPIARHLLLNETDFMRSRLTAFAIETDQFKRRDIYTLFVITRIINFLKSLPLQANADLQDILDANWPEPKLNSGFRLLNALLCSGMLYADTKQGLKENRRFDNALFRRVADRMPTVTCCNGFKIDTRYFAVTQRVQAQVC